MPYTYMDYKGKKCVVTGAASGMGEAVTMILGELGAEIYALDLKEPRIPVKQYIPINLGDQAAIDTAVSQLPDSIDCVFSCAGIPGVTYGTKKFNPVDVVTVNYIGTRYFVESMLPKLHEGSAIMIIASLAGMNWRNCIQRFKEFIDISDWKAAQDYVRSKSDDPEFIGGIPELNRPYLFSKECIILWAQRVAWNLAARRIRINTVSPAAVLTPMHGDFLEINGKPRDSSMDVSPAGFESKPLQQAATMVFVNSNLAEYLSGQDIQVDYAISSFVATGGGELFADIKEKAK